MVSRARIVGNAGFLQVVVGALSGISIGSLGHSPVQLLFPLTSTFWQFLCLAPPCESELPVVHACSDFSFQDSHDSRLTPVGIDANRTDLQSCTV